MLFLGACLPAERSLEPLTGLCVMWHIIFQWCRLLEETVTDPQCLQSLVCPLSGEEYLQVCITAPARR